MGKLFTPQDVSSGFNTTNSLNTNFDNIETALDRTLSRYGETPNAMQATLDMNDNPIINAGAIDCSSITIDGEEIPSVADLAAQAVLAQAAVTAAELAETNAEAAQTAAEAAQAAAEAAAATLNLPTLAPGDQGRALIVNATEDGYETGIVLPATSAPNEGKIVVFGTGGDSLESSDSPLNPLTAASTIGGLYGLGPDGTTATAYYPRICRSNWGLRAVNDYVENTNNVPKTNFWHLGTAGDFYLEVDLNTPTDAYIQVSPQYQAWPTGSFTDVVTIFDTDVEFTALTSDAIAYIGFMTIGGVGPFASSFDLVGFSLADGVVTVRTRGSLVGENSSLAVGSYVSGTSYNYRVVVRGSTVYYFFNGNLVHTTTNHNVGNLVQNPSWLCRTATANPTVGISTINVYNWTYTALMPFATV